MSHPFGKESLNFVCLRRELPGKLFVIAGALLLPKSQRENSVTQTETQPKFKIGDLVASDWVDDDDDEAPDSGTDFGEILGMRWVPERESGCKPNTWLYFVNWTQTTISGSLLSYPIYDGEPTRECDLRLAS